MSQYPPFVFGAGGGQAPPALPQQQSAAQQPNGTSGGLQPQAAPIPAQQSAFQQNGQVSATDLAALQGISPQQLAALFRVFQSGKFDPPPELPTVNSALAPTTTPQEQLQASGIQAPRLMDALAQEQDVDMDRDEGEIEEIEDAEPTSVKEARGFLHPPPTGPRKLHAPQLHQRKSSPRAPIHTLAAGSEHGNDIESKEFSLNCAGQSCFRSLPYPTYIWEPHHKSGSSSNSNIVRLLVKPQIREWSPFQVVNGSLRDHGRI